MASQQVWTEDYYSTHAGHAFDFTITQRSEEYCYETPQPCTLVSVIVDDELVINVPCFFCHLLHANHSNRNIDTYLSLFEQKISVTISSELAYIPRCCADVVASAFKLFLEANVVIRRSLAVGEGCPTTFHRVEIFTNTEEEIEAVMESSFDQEAAGPKMKPASVAAVRELIRSEYKREEDEMKKNGYRGENWSDCQCMICLDEIKTRRSSFTMDCSHVFHENCLLEWLDTSHVCPVCRYKLPTDD